jgi:poly-gamma-glutamate synthesis protein (capsule biosynthesis protein)
VPELTNADVSGALTPPSLRLALAGQSLIERPMHADPVAGGPLRALLGRADLAVTNLEVAMEGDPAGWPMRETTVHSAPETVLDSLMWFGFGAVALASNHTCDLGPPGVLAALDAAHRRSLLVAGAGVTAVAAAAPGSAEIAGRRVALVAAVAAANPPTAAALDASALLPARPGINRFRVRETLTVTAEDARVLEALEAMSVSSHRAAGAPEGLRVFGAEITVGAMRSSQLRGDGADLDRFLDTIGKARESNDIVIAYLHSHYWASPIDHTPEWARHLGRRCVDAGASVVLGHGTPVLQGLELYRDGLVAHGLGSFVFHTRRPAAYVDTAVWESLIVDVDIAPDGRIVEVRLHPMVHGRHPDLAAAPEGMPTLSGSVRAGSILRRVDLLSREFGTCVEISPEQPFGRLAVLSEAKR